MSRRSVDSYAKFSGYNSNEKQFNQTNYSSNYADLPPSQMPDPNNRFANAPPQPLPTSDVPIKHNVREIESNKLFQLLSDPNYHFNTRGPTKVFVKVYTDWCGPCKSIAPKIEELSVNPAYQDIMFVQLNGERIEENLKKFINVSAVPIFFGFVAGRQLGDYVVGPDMKKIVEKLDEMSQIK
jgi:thioredoxin 1